MTDFSDYIVYVDESGDHGLTSIDPAYPMFVLAFCIFKKSDYCEKVVPAVLQFKLKHFGHDMIVLHEHEIRKAKDPFKFLVEKAKRDEFMQDLDTLVEKAPFTLIASCIRKDHLKGQYVDAANPYHLSIVFGLERLHHFLEAHDQVGRRTAMVFERRGRREDEALELEFRRVCDGDNYNEVKMALDIVFADKRANSSGLQIADLLARPVGRKLHKPEQPNRAYDQLEPKLYRVSGQAAGWGLKCFP